MNMQSTVTAKAQKSSLWIWTTLWLTAFIDSGLIYSVFLYAVNSVLKTFPEAILVVVQLVVFVGSMWLGAYFALKYVLKRSIVPKIQATKFAILSVIIPAIFCFGSFLIGGIGIYNVIASVLTVVIIFYSIKQLITTHGD